MFMSFNSMTAYPPRGGSSSRSLLPDFGRMADTAAKRPKLDSPSNKPERKGRKSNNGGDKNSNPLISPTEKCKVCYEPAAKHIHYGAVTCFSCRAFFRRSIQNQSCDAYKCRKQGRCEINLKSRKSCQKCRFDKCLEVGMKSSWVLSEEERHRRFRKHREKLQHGEASTSASASAPSPSSARRNDYFGPGLDSDEEYDQRGYHYLADYSPRSNNSLETDTERRYSGQNSPSYVSPQPMSPLSAHHLAIADPSIVVAAAAAAAAKIKFMPGMSFNPLHNQGVPGSFVPPSHFLSMAQDPSLFGALSIDPNRPGPSSKPETVLIKTEDDEVIEGLMEARRVADVTDDEDDYDDQYNSDDEQHPGPSKLVTEITPDEISQIKSIARIHDINYKSVNFGEELIKEMVMSSVFGVPLSVNATMTAYRLMIQRVTKVAQGFDAFINLPHSTQSWLLKNNADMIVSLRGAVFFEKRKGGLDQILITMGVDDLMAARNMVTAAMKTTELKRIDYSTFNSLQYVDKKSETENRYNLLLQRVGNAVSFDPDLVKMLSYVLLFSVDFLDNDPEARQAVEATQESIIRMMQRYIYAQYSHKIAVRHFSRLLHCIADLRELTHIKKNRQLATSANIASDKVMVDPGKPTYFGGSSAAGSN